MRSTWLLVAGACAALLAAWVLVRSPTRRRALTPALDPTPVAAAALPEPDPAPVEQPAPVLAASSAPPALATENQFLHTLWDTSQSDKPRALALALAGDAQYPQTGTLAEARKALIVTLLVDLGRMEEARARVRRFIDDYPNSEYRPLVQGVTGIHPRPWGPGGQLR